MLNSRDYIVALLYDPAYELRFLIHELLFLSKKRTEKTHMMGKALFTLGKPV